jgi:hypothetical protein
MGDHTKQVTPMNPLSDRTLARWLLEHRDNGYFISAILRRSARGYAVCLLILGVFAGILALAESIGLFPASPTTFMVGLAAGMLLRDFGWFRLLKRQWSFRERTTDWNEVERLARGEP